MGNARRRGSYEDRKSDAIVEGKAHNPPRQCVGKQEFSYLDKARVLIGKGRVRCHLTLGHDGNHRDTTGAEWEAK